MTWLDAAETLLQIAGIGLASRGLYLTWTSESPAERLAKPPVDWMRERWHAVRYSRPLVGVLKRLGIGPRPVTMSAVMTAAAPTVSGRLHVRPPPLDPALPTAEALAHLSDRVQALDEEISTVKNGAEDAAAAIREDLRRAAERLQANIDEMQARAHQRVLSGVREGVLGLALVAAATSVGFLSRLLT